MSLYRKEAYSKNQWTERASSKWRSSCRLSADKLPAAIKTRLCIRKFPVWMCISH
jgi:hypothetical protein